VSAPGKATLSSRTMAMITRAARPLHRYDTSLVDVYACAKQQRDEVALEDFAAPRTIEDAVMEFAKAWRRGLR
jgi:hypothetical protein